jgi:hypothetical protein
MTLSIVDFLNARLVEDEAAALAADGTRWGQRDRTQPYVIHDVDAYKPGLGNSGRIIAAESLGTRDHIARHDPARVLREVAAKRALLDVYEIAEQTHDILGDGFIALDRAIRALAAVYPDCPEEWQQ